MIKVKRCYLCGEVKPLSEYTKRTSAKKDGLHTRCRTCTKKVWHVRKERDYPEGQRWRMIKRRYNMTKEQWEDMFEKQGRVCACCGVDNPNSSYNWHTDHCHDTGLVRGILCLSCNRGIGFLGTADVLLKAATYLTEHG